MITPVILCGGSGTRLWPLSRKSFPKQFVPLIDSKSLLQLTLERVSHLNKKVICVASEDHRFLVVDAMHTANINGNVILEPVARNTAAAMALAALQSKPETLLLFCPSDHHIPDVIAFTTLIQQGQAFLLKQAINKSTENTILTFGVNPTCPSSAYGYIRQGTSLRTYKKNNINAFEVAGFTEKPALNKAQALLLSGTTLWNSGIFLCAAKTILLALKKHAPDILSTCQEAMTNAITDNQFIRPHKATFESCRSESIDYAVMEKHHPVAVIPFTSAWSDVGYWNAVADLTPADPQGNRNHGQAISIESKHTFIHAPKRLVVALGTDNLFIIDTPDAILVAASSHVEKVKQVVAKLEQENIYQSVQHRKVGRPWGNYDSVDVGERHQIKRITVRPGAKLSLQMHYYRAEHWIIIKGTALVTKADEQILLKENQSTYIPLGVTHRLENPGKTDLEIIEVQSGSYLGEDDIVRFTDIYGREKS